MPFTQIRPVAGQMAKHVTAARRFSTAPILRKEIQDAYILSAARTPTAKVCHLLVESDAKSVNTS